MESQLKKGQTMQAMANNTEIKTAFKIWECNIEGFKLAIAKLNKEIAELEELRSRVDTPQSAPGRENRSTHLLRIFIDALPHYGFSFDADGRILEVLTGEKHISARVLEGKLIREVVAAEDAALPTETQQRET